ncbi:DUF5803 family protein [Methanocalculus sp. MC3]
MQSTNRDRCHLTCLALCLAALILASPAFAQNATFSINENASSYSASVEITDADSYQFTKPGYLGEAVPISVREIRVMGVHGEVSYDEQRNSVITFPEGDYIIAYEGDLDGNSFSALFKTPYNVTISLPGVYFVDNPLLGYVSQGGSVLVGENQTTILWESTRYAEIRFYDELRLFILSVFGTIWVVFMIILLFGYYSMRAASRRE